MNSLKVIALLLGSATASYVSIRAYLRFAVEHHVLDVPNDRSSHSVPTPRGGGVAFAAVFLVAAAILGATRTLLPQETLAIMTGLSLAVVGYLDDTRTVSIRTRLLIQIVSVCVAVVALTMLHIPDSAPSSALLVGIVVLLQAFGLTWMINLTNFMDGIDGITAIEIVTVSAISAALIMFRHGFTVPALLFVLLGVTVAPFLLFNWMPAKIFMGDAGSTFLGFTLGILSMIAVARHELSLFVPVIVFGVFVIDATMTLVTRMLRREKWYLPHNTHAFQILARRFDHKSVAGAVGVVNLVWLAPLAMAAEIDRKHGLLYVATALIPLVTLSRIVGAGQQQSEAVLSLQSIVNKTHCYVFLTKARTFSERHTSLLHLLSIAVLTVSCVYSALVLQFDRIFPRDIRSTLIAIIAIWSTVQCTILACFRVHRSQWRFTSIEELPRLVGTTLFASISGAIATSLVMHIYGVVITRPVYVLEILISILAFSGLRVFTRVAFSLEAILLPDSERQRVLICRAEASGVSILSEIRRRLPKYRPVGFIDDRPEVQGMSISGLPVLGTAGELGKIVKTHRINHVLINASTLSTCFAAEIKIKCLEENIELRTVTSFAESSVEVRPQQIRLGHLDGWPQHSRYGIDCSLIASEIEDRVIMVSGAAGAIGSELCRQLAAFRPRAIVGYETSEPGLFFLKREFRRQYSTISFIPSIGSVQDTQRLAEVLASSRPNLVYHADASMRFGGIEQSLFEVIDKNIVATQALVNACTMAGVRHLIVISTEETEHATRLVNATKRIAEMLVRASSSPNLKCTSIRLGSVLIDAVGTTESFRRISPAGPSIVAGSLMEPGAMTLDEAAQLILQVSSFGTPNRLYLLKTQRSTGTSDQSERISGLRSTLQDRKDLGDQPEGNYQTSPTSHPKIFVINNGSSQSVDVLFAVEQLRIACEQRQAINALQILLHIAPDYSPRKAPLNSVAVPDCVAAPLVQTPLGSVSGF